MRIVCLCNNWLGWQVLQWLRHRGQEIVGLVVHPQGTFLDEIRAVAEDAGCIVINDSMLPQAEVLEQIRSCRPEMAVSILFRDILRKPFLDLFPKGCINLHPAFLPYNRGNFPNVWCIVDKTPAGVTLHYLDEGLDTGDIIAQQRVPVEAVDTGGTLYRKLEKAALELFQKTWPSIESGTAQRRSQVGEPGTAHRRRDVRAIDEIHLDQCYRAEDLINILRARTFPPHPGAYFLQNDKKVYLSLELTEDSVSNLHEQEIEGKK